MSNENEPEIDQQLQDLQRRAGDLIPECKFASSSKLYGELRRRGRSEHRAHSYVWGTFFQMDQAQYLLDFQTMRERAIELIALLEDEEKLRQIQADFPREQYDFLVYTMSSCAYENLAEATGQLEGYNSEGMHACIADGIQICRRTGKTGCVSCFREYACDVYMSADDADIAAHQCRLVRDHEGNWSDRGDRRWLATVKLAWLDALNGKLDDALAGCESALELATAESVSLKYEARVRILLVRDAILIEAGQAPKLRDDEAFATFPGPGECPIFELQMDLNNALLATREKRYEEATRILTQWDQKLQKCGGTHLWFETRLRLIANKLLAGDRKQAETLARQLEQRARTAHDYLALRRLQTLLDADTASPFAPLVMPKAARKITAEPTSPDGRAASASAPPDEASSPEPTPLAAELESLRNRMTAFMQEPGEDEFNNIRNAVLAFDATQVTHADDACGLIHIMGYLVGAGDDGEKVWKWANSLVAPHRDHAVALSVLATLGDALRGSGNEEMAEKITSERTEQLHRKAMELDPTRPRNFLRAGDHFMSLDNHGEAERCYARAFRLDRQDGNIVRRLAELYKGTDRPRDALHVLDLSLREGCEDSQAAFDAAMLAFRLQQYDATLTYLEKYESVAGEVAWTNYYRSVCHYEQAEYEKAVECADRESKVMEADGWHLQLMRGVSLARMGRRDDAMKYIRLVLDTPLYQVDFLSPVGLMELLQRLAVVAEDVLQDNELVAEIERRLLRAGLMPESWFQHARESAGQEAVEGIRLYRCLVYQPLDERWQTDPDRQFDQDQWTGYFTEWGVLATSEEEATEIALKYQAMCADLPAEMREILPGDDTYTDVTGPVWQAARFSGDDEDMPSAEDGDLPWDEPEEE
ncbi:MAG: hypothetical protein JNM43_10685 [Planctomycetaceae bacterium]|nr:hypothetical protein [Planctomycetaceae bacterium]